MPVAVCYTVSSMVCDVPGVVAIWACGKFQVLYRSNEKYNRSEEWKMVITCRISTIHPARRYFMRCSLKNASDHVRRAVKKPACASRYVVKGHGRWRRCKGGASNMPECTCPAKADVHVAEPTKIITLKTHIMPTLLLITKMQRVGSISICS